jgi:cysteine synthase
VRNRRIKVPGRDALRATRELLEREGIFAGISSGAALHAPQRVARHGPPRGGDALGLMDEWPGRGVGPGRLGLRTARALIDLFGAR